MLQWSYNHDAKLHGASTVGQWLGRTSLFEQAWIIVCTGSGSWWWSSFICTFTVILTAIMWAEGTSGVSHLSCPVLLC